MKLISGSSNQPLAKKIGQKLNLPLVTTEITRFANGEKRVWIKENISGNHVVIIQSLSYPVDENIIELLLLIDALERAGAKDIHLIIPWLGYSLQDKVFRPGESIAVKVIANLISNSYIKRVYLLDVHNTSIPGFFSIPTSHLTAMDIFVAHTKDSFANSDLIVASPDFGGLKRAQVFADKLGVGIVNIDKDRNLETGNIQSSILHGSVKDKTVLLFDDTVQSGGTVYEDSLVLKQAGATEIILFVTHGPMINKAYQKIDDSKIKQAIVTNSVEHLGSSKKLTVLDVSGLFASALEEWF